MKRRVWKWFTTEFPPHNWWKPEQRYPGLSEVNRTSATDVAESQVFSLAELQHSSVSPLCWQHHLPAPPVRMQLSSTRRTWSITSMAPREALGCGERLHGIALGIQPAAFQPCKGTVLLYVLTTSYGKPEVSNATNVLKKKGGGGGTEKKNNYKSKQGYLYVLPPWLFIISDSKMSQRGQGNLRTPDKVRPATPQLLWSPPLK